HSLARSRVLYRPGYDVEALHDRRTAAYHSDDDDCRGYDLHDANGSRGRHEDREDLRKWRHGRRSGPTASWCALTRTESRERKKPREVPGLLLRSPQQARRFRVPWN